MTSWKFGAYLSGMHDVGAQLSDHVARRTEAALAGGHAVNDALQTPEDVRRRQRQVREAVERGVGGLVARPDGPPAAELVGQQECDGYLLERLILEVAEGVFAPANLYLPQGSGSQRSGGVVFLCGHSPLGKAAPVYQAACAKLARNGLVVLVVDPIGQGERWSYLDADGTVRVRGTMPEHSYAGVQCWWIGDAITRYFIHDAQRAFDYLASRPEVDPERIGVAGNSGGGTLTTWLLAVEPRIAAAVASCVISDRSAIMRSGKAQDAEQHLPGGALAGVDHEDLLLTMAPRPVLVCSANYDFFPIDGTMRTLERTRRIFGLLGAEQALEQVRNDSTHGFAPGLTEGMTRFLVRHLGNDPAAEIDVTEPVPLPEEQLWCSRTGQIVLDRPQTRRVFDLNLERYRQRGGARRDRTGRLRERVEAHRQVPAEFFPRWEAADAVGSGVEVRRGFWASEVDLVTAGILVTAPDRAYRELQIVLFDQGSDEVDDHQSWLAERASSEGVASLVVDVRGTGAVAPRSVNAHHPERDYGTMFKLLTELIWLDDSLAAGQVFDVIRAVEFAAVDPVVAAADRPISLYGEGAGSFLAQLAGSLLPQLSAVTLATPPLDPDTIVTSRYYGDERDWLATIPGLI